MEGSARTGVLLLNVGTPEAATTPAVRRYLREFLSDPRVIDIPQPWRWLTLNLFILPFRPQRSAALYRKIWDENGSPLLFHSLSLQRALQAALGSDFAVELGMRYGSPSIASALTRLRAQRVTTLQVAPMYPLYAASSTGTSLEEVYRLVGRDWNVPALRVLPPFWDRPEFLDASAAVARPSIEAGRAEFLLVSFHGLPERHLRRSAPNHCLQSETCCDRAVPENRYCYRFEAFGTARELARRLGFDAEHYAVSFQSRLGRTPWIRPYTDLVVPALAHRGIKRLAVITPSFTADCLETLEEIGIRARTSFLAEGGEELILAPCVNSHPDWVAALAGWARAAGEGNLPLAQ